jgi:hypothetical protein
LERSQLGNISRIILKSFLNNTYISKNSLFLSWVVVDPSQKKIALNGKTLHVWLMLILIRSRKNTWRKNLGKIPIEFGKDPEKVR